VGSSTNHNRLFSSNNTQLSKEYKNREQEKQQIKNLPQRSLQQKRLLPLKKLQRSNIS